MCGISSKSQQHLAVRWSSRVIFLVGLHVWAVCCGEHQHLASAALALGGLAATLGHIHQKRTHWTLAPGILGGILALFGVAFGFCPVLLRSCVVFLAATSAVLTLICFPPLRVPATSGPWGVGVVLHTWDRHDYVQTRVCAKEKVPRRDIFTLKIFYPVRQAEARRATPAPFLLSPIYASLSSRFWPRRSDMCESSYTYGQFVARHSLPNARLGLAIAPRAPPLRIVLYTHGQVCACVCVCVCV